MTDLPSLSPQQLRERLELADASMDAEAWLALLAEVERRCGRAEEAERPAASWKPWVERLRQSCLATYCGGHSEPQTIEAFRHGMETVCNALAAGGPPMPPASRIVAKLTDELIAAAEDVVAYHTQSRLADRLGRALAALTAVRRLEAEK